MRRRSRKQNRKKDPNKPTTLKNQNPLLHNPKTKASRRRGRRVRRSKNEIRKRARKSKVGSNVTHAHKCFPPKLSFLTISTSSAMPNSNDLYSFVDYNPFNDYGLASLAFLFNCLHFGNTAILSLFVDAD
jgi:hypothetical protein